MRVSRYDYGGDLPDPEAVTRRLARILVRGNYVLSAEVSEFETAFANYLGINHAVGLNSGTDALAIALRCLGVGPGDEVITQPNTYHATVLAICAVGATPVLVDVDEASFCLTRPSVEGALTARTKAVIVVHLYGRPAPMSGMLELAERSQLAIVEDAAHAHGAMWQGKRVGTIGDVGCFSFHPSKNLAAAGDAGALVTASSEVASGARMLRNLGQWAQNDHRVLGMNSRLDAVQAVVLAAKLPGLDQRNCARRRVVTRYRELLAGCPVTWQSEDADGEHVYHLFAVRGPDRDLLVRHLVEAGVEAVVRYPVPIHLQPAFRQFEWGPGDFPVAERLAAELLCLPVRPTLDDSAIAYVASCVRSFYGVRRG